MYPYVVQAPGIPSTLAGGQVIVVAPNGGRYTTLSAALAAISDNAVGKQYEIRVFGDIAETATITAKDYIHVTGGGGASITMTSTSGHGFDFNNLVSSIWRGLKLVRAGSAGSGSLYCAQFRGTTTAGVRIENCVLDNQSTGQSFLHGANIQDTAAPYLENCQIKCTNTSAHRGFGVYFQGGTPQLVNCELIGGGTIAGGYGCGLIGASVSPVLRNCRITTTAPSIAVYLNHTAGTAKFLGCSIEAGGGAASQYGVYAFTGLTGLTEFNNCYIKGGDGGTLCHAFVSDYGIQICTNCHFVPGLLGGHAVHCRTQSGATFNSCTLQLPDVGGSGCGAVFCGGGAAPTFQNCCTKLNGNNGSSNFTATGTFVPSATYPLQIAGITIQVGTAGGAGATVSIGTSAGGTQIVNAQAITGTGAKYPVLGAGALDILAAGATLYVTIAAGGGSPNIDVQWMAFRSIANIQAVYMQDSSGANFNNCALVSAGASDAVYMTADVVTANKIRFSSCHIEARPATTPKKAINAASAYNPAPIYNCTLVGGNTNITAAAGTANGSNIEL